jgi:hypothetical protein
MRRVTIQGHQVRIREALTSPNASVLARGRTYGRSHPMAEAQRARSCGREDANPRCPRDYTSCGPTVTTLSSAARHIIFTGLSMFVAPVGRITATVDPVVLRCGPELDMILKPGDSRNILVLPR